jgi:O-antigen/teichoic acid export membrane protein
MLTKKASLNAVAAVLDQAARIVVGVCLNPILVGALGQSGFGNWQLLQRVFLQIGTLDGRAAEFLKWSVANEQRSDEIAPKREMLTAAICTSLFFLPGIVGLTLVFCLWGPAFLVVTSEIQQFRIAGILLAVNVVLMAAFGIAEAVLRGSNLGYKRMGLFASLQILAACLSAMAVHLGYGMVGLAAVQVAFSFVFLALLLGVVRKHVTWVGFAWPPRRQLETALSYAIWYTCWAFVNTAIASGDVLVLGAFASSGLVSQYVLTNYSAQLVAVAILTTVSAVLPGLGGVIGAGHLTKAKSICEESALFSWLLSCAIIVTLIVVNEPFVSLWVGQENFAGQFDNILILACSLQLVLIRHDSFLLNLAINIREKVIYGMLSLVLMLSASVILVPTFAIGGVCVAMLFGRSIMSLMYPRILAKFLGARGVRRIIGMRAWCVACILACGGVFLGAVVEIDSWTELVIATIAIATTNLSILSMFGLNAHQRSLLYYRIRQIPAQYKKET